MGFASNGICRTVHRVNDLQKNPQYLKDPMIPSERLHVHGNKQLLPRTRIDIFKRVSPFQAP